MRKARRSIRRAQSAACRRRRCWCSIRPATSSVRGAAQGDNLGYDWPQQEHSILVDNKGFVWLSGNGKTDGMVLKFTTDGKFVNSAKLVR